MRHTAVQESPFLVPILAALVGGLLCTSAASAQVNHRPIQEFVDAQGTYFLDDGTGNEFLFIPPVKNYIGWFDPNGLGMSVDYAGLADDYLGGALGTTFAGSITERARKDGSCVVRVVLHTHNALTWVVPWDDDDSNPFGENDLIFGVRAADVEEGAWPALADSSLVLEYVAPECGLPIKDFIEVLFFPTEDCYVTSLKFIASASGFYADGSPGRAHVIQVGLFDTGFHGAVGDGFPAERVTLSGQ